MKYFSIILFLLSAFLRINAQECPPEWVKYTYGEYFYDIQSDHNYKHLSETEFKNYLLNIARTNLAKQIKITIHDISAIDKTANNGRTNIKYASSTNFITDLNMKLVETRVMYNSTTKEGYAIAFIDRNSAKNYYNNELALANNKINQSLGLADNYIKQGFKNKAQSELEKSLSLYSLAEESLFWLNIFGTSQSDLDDWQQVFNQSEQKVKQMLAELKHATRIYLVYNGDLFGKSYPSLQNELKGALASDGCSFTDRKANADWIIRISCSAKEHSNVKIGNVISYLSYVNAHIIIEKASSSQRIYEDEISCKGGHNFNYTEAAKMAYKEIKGKLENNIKKHIYQ